jgi:hypothetical protein
MEKRKPVAIAAKVIVTAADGKLNNIKNSYDTVSALCEMCSRLGAEGGTWASEGRGNRGVEKTT